MCLIALNLQCVRFWFFFFSLNFCSADVCVSVFVRPAMNLDKSGWNLE